MTGLFTVMGLFLALLAVLYAASSRMAKSELKKQEAERAKKAAASYDRERTITHEANGMDFDSLLDANDRLRNDRNG